MKNFSIILVLYLFSSFQVIAETQSCNRTSIDISVFTTSRAAESWYPKNLYVNTYYDKKL